MSNSLPTDEEIRGRVRTAMQNLIVRDSALAADVVPCVQGMVMEIVREFRLENERLHETFLSIQRGEIKPGELTIEGVSPVVAIMAAGCYDMLNHRKAENYVEFDMIPKAGARAVRVTVAWLNGKSPAQRVIEMEQENELLRAQVPSHAVVQAIVGLLTDNLAYYEDDDPDIKVLTSWIDKLDKLESEADA